MALVVETSVKLSPLLMPPAIVWPPATPDGATKSTPGEADERMLDVPLSRPAGTPLTILLASSGGMSAAVRLRKVGETPIPVPAAGPAKTELAACAARARANVPLAVIGDPATGD